MLPQLPLRSLRSPLAVISLAFSGLASEGCTDAGPSPSGSGSAAPIASGGASGGHVGGSEAGGARSSGGAANGGSGGKVVTTGGVSGLAGASNLGGQGTGGDDGDGGSASGVGGSGTGGSGSASVDVFGITKLYPDGGAEWTSEHWSNGPYTVEFGEDSEDPAELSGSRGDGTLTVNSSAELMMSGTEPRIYIYPDETHEWRDIEVTVYYERVEDEGTAYSGLVVGVRSGVDGHTTDGACDAHTYYARLRHDGAIDFEKELKHPASSVTARVDPAEVWPPDGKLPFQQWIGWKFVIYNLDDTRVQLEAYRDLSGGQDGGDWKLMNVTIDDGGWFAETDCAEHSPSGGESDLVVRNGGAILVRNTNVTEARYRALTVREIEAP